MLKGSQVLLTILESLRPILTILLINIRMCRPILTPPVQYVTTTLGFQACTTRLCGCVAISVMHDELMYQMTMCRCYLFAAVPTAIQDAAMHADLPVWRV